uniref:AAA domain protein n=1 Tax=Mimivirus LCMiAC01 TaxID=2506608 RepID=A0A481YZW1_9VIRU|nr:MAG: AAA domain protein [Mimivirus LCMiAC01]
MNVVEAYIKFKGQLIIFISGLSGCGKIAIAKKISNNFKIHLIEQFNYYKKNYDQKITLPNGTTIINLYTDDAFDWDRLNDDINKVKHEGVVVTGVSLTNKIITKPDHHIHLSMSKQICLERRRKYIRTNKEKYPDEFKQIDTTIEKFKMNRLYTYYLDSIKKSKINEFLKTNIMSIEDMWDKVWDILIHKHISKYLGWFNEKQYTTWKKKYPSPLKPVKSDTITPEPKIVSSDEDIDETDIDATDVTDVTDATDMTDDNDAIDGTDDDTDDNTDDDTNNDT